jgi:hypothetical protein
VARTIAGDENGKIEAVVFSNAKHVEPYLIRQRSRFDCFVDAVMGIHLNSRLGVRDEIGERIKTEFHSCQPSVQLLKKANIRILEVAERSS